MKLCSCVRAEDEFTVGSRTGANGGATVGPGMFAASGSGAPKFLDDLNLKSLRARRRSKDDEAFAAGGALAEAAAG